VRPSFAKFVRPEDRGRREDRVRAAPAVSRANAHSKKRTRAYRFSGSSPAFPAQWFYGLFRALPGETRLVCHRRPQEARASQELDTSHWGVRTTRLCRPLKRCSSIASLRPSHPAPTSVTIAIRPSSRARDGKIYAGDLGQKQRRIFFVRGLDMICRKRGDLPDEAGQEVMLTGLSGSKLSRGVGRREEQPEGL
jgi:hypothetical protein